MSFQSRTTARDAVLVSWDIVSEAHEKNLPFMAGSIAYSAFVSLLPLVLLLAIAASVVGGERLVDYVRRVTESYLTPTSQSLLTENIGQAGSQTGISILGLVVLVWGVLRVFRALDTAFSAIYDTQQHSSLSNQLTDGLVVLGAFSVALLAVLAASLGLQFLPALPFPRLISQGLLIVGLTVVFVPIYYVFPDVDLSLGMVLPGAVVAAVGWAFLKGSFGIYARYSSTQDLYGVIGGIVLLITFLYFGALVILIGAVANVVLAGRRRTVAVDRQAPR